MKFRTPSIATSDADWIFLSLHSVWSERWNTWWDSFFRVPLIYPRLRRTGPNRATDPSCVRRLSL